MRRVLAVFAAIAIAGGFMTVGASLAAPGEITACVQKDGLLRIIDPAVEKCVAGETPLAWAIQGEQGPQGPVGPAGPASKVVCPECSLVGWSADIDEQVQMIDETGVLLDLNLADAFIPGVDGESLTLYGINLNGAFAPYALFDYVTID